VAASPRGSSATEGPVEGVQALGLAHRPPSQLGPPSGELSIERAIDRVRIARRGSATPPSVRNGMPLSRSI
jgi:hypothetical protein